ncbi:NADPH-dependent FMN reductase [Derxia gummosa]|uniref:NADPH-dependent FMN reductase n=1 Tax=Derxia gummosa DSM 723 TaxID=1121388 RepID=A0A8B6X8I1_9BURK|nr:NADPH-dependent FMN reductase [Derxia gummosa]
MSITFISGSPQARSRSNALLDVIRHQVVARGATVEDVRVRELPADALFGLDIEQPPLKAALGRVARASAVVIATPIYKASYTGLLKSFLDLLPQDGLKDKIVLPIATGGSPAHLLAIDYAIKPMLAALGARWIVGSVYASDAQIGKRDDGGYQPDAEIAARLDEASRQLLHALDWAREHRVAPARAVLAA